MTTAPSPAGPGAAPVAAPAGGAGRLLPVLLGAALALGIVLRVSAVLGGELWLDEYHSLLAAGQPSVERVLAVVAADPHPPAYWLLLHLVLRLVGSDPLVARGLSLAFGTAALLVVALVARRRWGPPSAVVAAIVLGCSALAIHYSSEIRPYSLAALAILAGLLATESAVERPSRRAQAVQLAVLAGALWVNFFSLTLLAVGPGLALARRRLRLVPAQAAIGALALLAASPPLARVVTQLPPEANEYVRAQWAGRSAVDAVVEVGRDLLPSARWPLAHGPGARRTPIDTPLELFAAAGALLVAAGAARFACRQEAAGGALAAACLLLLGAAASLAAASVLLGRPVVTPGRFAASFLPPAALLAGAAVTWRRAGRAGALLLAAVALANAVATLRASGEPIRVDRGRLVSLVAARELHGPLLVLSVGLTGTPLKYELGGRDDVAFASFPPDVDAHFGWWAPAKALGDPGRLAREAETLARRAVAAAGEGRTVLLTGADHPVAEPLRAALGRSFLARPLHPLARGAFVLVLRDPAGVASPAPQRR